MFAALFGFVSGIAFGSIFKFGFSLAALCFFIGVLFLFAGRRSVFIFSASVFLIFSTLGLVRTEIEKYRYVNDLSETENIRVTIRGIVDEYPDLRTGNVRFNLVPEEISSASGEFISNEKILVSVPIFPKVKYGDEILVKGILKPIENFAQDSAGSAFDYRKYMADAGVFHEISSGDFSVVSSGHGNKIVSFLFAVREKFSDKIRENIGEPESSLALGMLLGEKHGLTKELTDTFKRAGIVHMIVLSGYNIALVSQFFMKVFSFLPVVYRTCSGGLAIILFVVMTGGGASAVRAAIMALIALLGTATGRTYTAGRALFIAGALMLMENPSILFFDASFQLSFLATLGLIYLSPVIFDWLGKWRPVVLKELISQTIATQIAVLPMLIYLSGMVSVVSLPVNILVLPSSPLQMFGAFVTGILGFFGHAVTLPFAVVTSLLLSHTITTAKFFASLLFAVVEIGVTGFLAVCAIYVVGILYFIFKKRSATLR